MADHERRVPDRALVAACRDRRCHRELLRTCALGRYLVRGPDHGSLRSLRPSFALGYESAVRVCWDSAGGPLADRQASRALLTGMSIEARIATNGATEPSGYSAAVVVCCSCPRQVGEGNLLCGCQLPGATGTCVTPGT